MTERARDYVTRVMAEKYTPEELAALNKETAEWLDSLGECDKAGRMTPAEQRKADRRAADLARKEAHRKQREGKA